MSCNKTNQEITAFSRTDVLCIVVRDIKMIRLICVPCLLFVLCLMSRSRAGPPCPRPCICDYYASIHTIDCNGQELTGLPNGIPEWTTSINFDGNFLTRFDLTRFNITVYFEEFRLRYNEITEIMVNNKSTAHIAGFKGACNSINKLFPRLTQVNLRGNRLKKLPKCLLSTWPALKILNLNENRFESLKDLNMVDHVYYYDSLEEIFLRRNKIKKLSREDLFSPANGLRNVKIIDLSENSISHLDADAFMFMPELRDLRLQDNQIRSLPEKAFVTLGQSIETIQLNQNHIDSIAGLAFAGLPKLSRLDLRDNAIQCLTTRTLSTCDISSAQHQANRTAQKLDSFELPSDNSSQRFSLNLAALHQLRIKGNPWKCECSLKPLMADERMQRIVYPSIRELSCKSPTRYRNYYLPRAIGSMANCGM